MKTKSPSLRLALFAIYASSLLLSGCASSSTTAPTDKQQLVANAVEDTLSVGLVPVLTKNPDYITVANGIAAALGTFTGDTLSSANVEAFLAHTALAPEDARTIAALVNAAWDTYTRRYAQQVNSSVRPDVKLFLGAVSNGIKRAVAALPPQPVAMNRHQVRALAASYERIADHLRRELMDPGDDMTFAEYARWEAVERELRDRSELLAKR